MDERERKQLQADVATLAAAQPPTVMDDPEWKRRDRAAWDRKRAGEGKRQKQPRPVTEKDR